MASIPDELELNYFAKNWCLQIVGVCRRAAKYGRGGRQNAGHTPGQYCCSAVPRARFPAGWGDICKYFGLPESKIVSVKDRAFNDQRYFIGSNKLADLGWVERTSWEEGLKKTIQLLSHQNHPCRPDARCLHCTSAQWYLECQTGEYWNGDVENALQPHPFAPTTVSTAPIL
eukprot:363664-Chlamydomonas_euryale.AAC.26